MKRDRLKSDIKRHEGYRPLAYADSVGVLTIGYGRNIEHMGISEHEADFMLENDIERAIDDARKLFPNFKDLSDKRQEVIVNMMFNLGYGRLSKFIKFRRALSHGKWREAAKEMRDSRWAVQVGKRARELSKNMEDD